MHACAHVCTHVCIWLNCEKATIVNNRAYWRGNIPFIFFHEHSLNISNTLWKATMALSIPGWHDLPASQPRLVAGAANCAATFDREPSGTRHRRLENALEELGFAELGYRFMIHDFPWLLAPKKMKISNSWRLSGGFDIEHLLSSQRTQRFWASQGWTPHCWPQIFNPPLETPG